MSNDKEIKNFYIDNFNIFGKKNIPGFDEIRTKAIEEFNIEKFPTKKDEEWKYTNIKPILKNRFVPSPIFNKDVENLDIVEDYKIPDFDAYRFVFINGIFNKQLSNETILSDGIIAGSLYNLNETKNSILKKIFTEQEKTVKGNIFNTLNTAFLYDGFVFYMRKNNVIDKPLHIINIATSESKKPLIQPKNFIYLEDNTSAEIIFEYIGEENSEYFTNTVSNITLEENSLLKFYKIQNESEKAFHIERTDIKQQNSSSVKHFSLSFGAAITRNDINAKLDGENIECNLYGLYLGNKNQQIDNHTFIEHSEPNCNSNELYKGILDNEAKGIFSGKILVQKEAQKTNAFQSNKSVLLSDKAISNSKPQLEIYADDVKCSHGATVGKLDQEALFYIRSRGVPLEAARSMLIRAFIDDVVKEITIEQLKEKVNHTIFEHLQRVEF